ncbi:asparaginase [Fodinibius salsisoli]|uniref:asparaginase n=1 Tax=Fodinibius salsisoli TaxID=2820877 RepID=A0ABT3PN92_9BACT|nr:asparaginase [Fodinibius salsisoli]MCW9706644.1 asparaginase [Fodinibius salsisoli]
MKNILLIQTGGTIAMDSGDDQKPTLNASKWADLIDGALPELAEIAKVDTHKLFMEDSSDINRKHWVALASFIHKQYQNYDGFVVLHGTDTMAYTASALSFALQNTHKPIILTGSQVPMSSIRSDARRNLVNAIEIATMDLPEIAICFNDHVFRGNRSSKISIGDFDAFGSPNYPPLAEIGLHIELQNHLQEPSGELRLSTDFSDQLFLLKIYPNLNPAFLQEIPLQGVRALVIEAFGSGNFPLSGDYSLIPFFKQCLENDILLVFTSQAAYDAVDLSNYESGRQALQLGALSAGDMTTEATLTKLMYLLGNHADNSVVSKKFIQNIAGELTE